MAGKPFVQYEVYDASRDFATLSICIPTEKEVFISSISDVTTAKIIPFTCLKTTLVGDYSHTEEAWTKAQKYVSDNGLIQNTAGKYVKVYIKTIDDIKQPSKWVTELYLPVFPKVEIAKPSIIRATSVIAPAETAPPPATNP